MYHTAILAMMLTGQLVAARLPPVFDCIWFHVKGFVLRINQHFFNTHYVPVYPDIMCISTIISEQSYGMCCLLWEFTLTDPPFVAGIHPLFPILFLIMVAALWFAAARFTRNGHWNARKCIGISQNSLFH